MALRRYIEHLRHADEFTFIARDTLMIFALLFVDFFTLTL